MIIYREAERNDKLDILLLSLWKVHNCFVFFSATPKLNCNL